MAGSHGYHIFLCNTDLDAQKEESYVYTLLERQVDGLLFASSTATTPKNITRIQKVNKPIILLDACMHDEAIPHVYIDNCFGVYTATKHLIEKGHTSIAFITGSMNLSTSKERLRGYKMALELVYLSRSNLSQKEIILLKVVLEQWNFSTYSPIQV